METNDEPKNDLDMTEENGNDEDNSSMPDADSDLSGDDNEEEEEEEDAELDDDTAEYDYTDSDMDGDDNSDAGIAMDPRLVSTAKSKAPVSSAETGKSESEEKGHGNIKLLDQILRDCDDVFPVPVSQEDEEFRSLITADKKRPRVSKSPTKDSAAQTEPPVQTPKPDKKGKKETKDCYKTSTLKAGVGYERGTAMRSTSDLVKKMEAAEKKQQALDETCCSLLKGLCGFLDDFDGDEGIVLLALKMSRGLNRMLFSILKNDSFEGLGKRPDVYLSTLEFLDKISFSKFLSSFLLHDLLEGDGTGYSKGESSCETLLTTLYQQDGMLAQSQEKVLKDARVQYNSTATEMSSEICATRNSIKVCNKMRVTLDNVTSAIQLGRKAGTISEAIDEAFVTKPTMPAGQKTDKEGIPLVDKEDYCKIMRKHRFASVAMLELVEKNAVSYYFHNLVGKKAPAADVLPQRMLRIHSEVAGLSRDLPVEWGSSIFVRIDEERPDAMKACIMAPEGTPYENGVFEFDIKLPDDYPNQPPLVQFVTTNKNQTRFNPNLYSSGKVCLSLLGTWEGPGWIPKTSTLLQVLISIQSLILVPDPYFNEPGYDPSSDEAKRQSAIYDNQIRAATMKIAILEQLENPPTLFKKCVNDHFRLKKCRILKQLAEWEDKVKEYEEKRESSRNENSRGPDNYGVVAGGGIRPCSSMVREIRGKIEACLKEKFPEKEDSG